MFSIHERSARHQVECIILGHAKRCPDCQTKLKPAREYLWCKSCRRKVRVKALTWLRGCKLSYKNLLVLLEAWQQDLSPKAVKQLTDLSYPTMTRWYARFRDNLSKAQSKLSGVVEVDEAFFGRRKHNNQQIVIGAIERSSGYIRLRIILDREQDSLEGFLVDVVKPGSLISTDAWSGYSDLEWYGQEHWQSNHSAGQFSETNRIENVWSVMKRRIRRVYGVLRAHYLPTLMREMEARCNFPELFENSISYLQVCLFHVS